MADRKIIRSKQKNRGMPYILRKAPGKPAYWVVNAKTGHKFSEKPLPLGIAEKQRIALYIAERGRGQTRRRPASAKTVKTRRNSRGKRKHQ